MSRQQHAVASLLIKFPYRLVPSFPFILNTREKLAEYFSEARVLIKSFSLMHVARRNILATAKSAEKNRGRKMKNNNAERLLKALEKLNFLLKELNGIKRRRFIGRKSNSELHCFHT